MSGCHVPSCLGTCCGDMKERISKLELAMNNEAENSSFMAAEESMLAMQEQIRKLLIHHNLQIDENRKSSRRMDEMTKQFNLALQANSNNLCEKISEQYSRIEKLEEQVKVLQSVINSAQQDSVTDLVENKPKNSDKLRDLMRNGPLITDPTFYEALDDSKSDESDMLKNNCDCDCHNLLVNSHCLDCLNNHPESKKRRENIMHSLAKDIDNHIQQAIGPQKKTKTYWVNVYKIKGRIVIGSIIYYSLEAASPETKDDEYLKTISFELGEE